MSRKFALIALLGSVMLAVEKLPAETPRDAATNASTEAGEFFEARIRPVLVERCQKCHGNKKASSDLRLDSREAVLTGGVRGRAVVPGDVEGSLLIRALRHTDNDLQMPPDGRLGEQTIADFTRWVREGAVWPQGDPTNGTGGSSAQRHWAYVPVGDVAPPQDDSGRSAGAIDRFINATLLQHGLRPNEPASKRVLLRRAYFDLIGLPPAPDEIDAFLANDAPDSFAKVVDRLLESPHYGERWGRHWMDVVRYADTAGDNADYPIPEARRYRDYVIDSFNADKPYNEFVREQIAGDLMARDGPREKYAERVVATGFLALSRRYATGPYELWHLTLEGAIDTVGRTFMGLTLRCARCHDHKFEPVSHEDYYALYGIFASTQFPYAGSEEFVSRSTPRQHFVPLLPPHEAKPLLAEYMQRIAELEAEIARIAEQAESDASLAGKHNALQTELKRLRRRGHSPKLPVAYAVTDGEIVEPRVHIAGNPKQPGDAVPRGVPRFLAGDEAPVIPDDESGRLQLARWLTRPDHPLAARVMVNRIWQHHFGRGLVATPSNFGRSGAEPTHPGLLDWLARRFVESGWSTKTMHRLIMTSSTYRISSRYDAEKARVDGANRYYWRYERRRLDAEAIRDAILALSGRLQRERPGDHPFPPIEQWGWTQHSPFKDVYPSPHRSVYLMTQRLQRHPYLALFDGPDTNTTTALRGSSTVPLQALFFINSDLLRRESEAFARRLIGASEDPRVRIRLAHELAYGRPPKDVECERGVRFIGEYRDALKREGAPAEESELKAWLAYARTIFASNEFVYLD